MGDADVRHHSTAQWSPEFHIRIGWLPSEQRAVTTRLTQVGTSMWKITHRRWQSKHFDRNQNMPVRGTGPGHPTNVRNIDTSLLRRIAKIEVMSAHNNNARITYDDRLDRAREECVAHAIHSVRNRDYIKCAEF